MQARSEEYFDRSGLRQLRAVSARTSLSEVSSSRNALSTAFASCSVLTASSPRRSASHCELGRCFDMRQTKFYALSVERRMTSLPFPITKAESKRKFGIVDFPLRVRPVTWLTVPRGWRRTSKHAASFRCTSIAPLPENPRTGAIVASRGACIRGGRFHSGPKSKSVRGDGSRGFPYAPAGAHPHADQFGSHVR